MTSSSPPHATHARLNGQAERGGYALITAESLIRLQQDGKLFVVDLRDSEKYASGHIPGAFCFPLPLTWRARFFKRWWLKKLLCSTTCKAVAFY